MERMTRLARLTRLPTLRHAHETPKSSAGEFLPLHGCSFRASIKARLKNGADDEARTRYLHLGKVALYQMSYIRKSESRYYGFPVVPSVGIEPTTRGFSVLCSTN